MKRRALLLTLTFVLALCAACGWSLHRERQYAINRQLIAALKDGDTTKALALVNAGADPNTRYDPPPAPTLYLILTRLLHHKRMPVNKTSTALMIACGNTRITDEPVVGKIFVDSPENVVLIRAMLAHGANVNAKDFDEHTALSDAARSGRLQTMELLLQHGANVNVQDEWGQTPLMLVLHGRNESVIQGRSLSMVRLLFSHGALPNVQNEIGWTALHYALALPNAQSLIPLFLEHGADLSLRDKDGFTPLLFAQRIERPDLAPLLKQHGAK